jgi:hypothetical protein
LFDGTRSKGCGVVQFSQVPEAETAIGESTLLMYLNSAQYLSQLNSKIICMVAGPWRFPSMTDGTRLPILLPGVGTLTVWIRLEINYVSLRLLFSCTLHLVTCCKNLVISLGPRSGICQANTFFVTSINTLYIGKNCPSRYLSTHEWYNSDQPREKKPSTSISRRCC